MTKPLGLLAFKDMAGTIHRIPVGQINDIQDVSNLGRLDHFGNVIQAKVHLDQNREPIESPDSASLLSDIFHDIINGRDSNKGDYVADPAEDSD